MATTPHNPAPDVSKGASESADENDVEIDISIPCSSWQDALPGADEICRRAVRAALLAAVEGRAASAIPAAEVSLVLADDDFIRGLNRQYRKIDRATNVLAFPGDDPREGLHVRDLSMPILLGDVVIAYETAAVEAADEDKSLADHLSHLVVHGTLHLLGFDHENDAEARTMEALEVAALAALGVRDPYADGAH